MKIDRYANPEHEFETFRLGYGFASIKEVKESLELHQSKSDFSCTVCRKECKGTQFFIGNGEQRLCPECGFKRFDELKRYISALRSLGRFHKKLLKRMQRRIETAEFNSKL
jgi:hypothetical protein